MFIPFSLTHLLDHLNIFLYMGFGLKIESRTQDYRWSIDLMIVLLNTFFILDY